MVWIFLAASVACMGAALLLGVRALGPAPSDQHRLALQLLAAWSAVGAGLLLWAGHEAHQRARN